MKSQLPHLALAALAAAVLASPTLADEKKGNAADRYWVFIGTYTGGKSKGIYRAELDPATGKLGEPQLAAELKNPTFVAIPPDGRFLYSVNEVPDIGGKRGGGVTSFALDRATGELTRLNQESSGGAGPCHIVTDSKGKFVFVANYGGGSAAALPVGPDGKLGKATGFVQHKGSSVNKSRQEAPHAHSINLDAANRFAFVADLGLDQVLVYRFDREKGTLEPNDPPHAAVAPGAGPRHFAFHPTGKYAYVINELDCTVTAFAYDPDKGVLTKLQTLSTLPDGKVQKGYSTAEVVVHPSGKFVYGSNRGQNSIAIFRVDPKTGELTHVGNQGKDVKTPRNFAIEPTGRFLLVGNQDGHSVIVFRIDQGTGELQPTESRIEVPSPVCLRFVPKGS